MVCSIGSVKMTVMARILASGGFEQAVSGEKYGCQKLVSQYIRKKLLEADDANLIDEEDMYVFDLNPLTDHLQLVCCNSCKKPVKASQFLVHRERCSSLGYAGELPLDLGSGTGRRKPPKKDRKKMVSLGNHVKSMGPQERFAILDAPEPAVSTARLDDPVGHTSPCLVESKDIPGKDSGSVAEVIPLTKRPKLLTATTTQSSNDVRTVPDVPAPLATKMYYSQRNNRLQAAISYMYHRKERESQGNLITWETSNKKHFPSSFGTKAVNQFGQSSATSLGNTGCRPSNNSVDQVMTDADAYKSEVTSFGTMTSKFQPESFSFSDNSGQPVPRIQQPNGSVQLCRQKAL